MTDPVTALAAVSTASSIISVIDFAGRVAFNAYRLTKSSQNTLQENVETETLCKEYDTIATQVGSPQPKPLSREEQTVERLAERCTLEARELLSMLEELKIEDGSHGMKQAWQSLTKAGKAMLKKSDIEAKRQSLHDLNGRLATALLQLLRSSEAAKFKDLFAFIASIQRHDQNVATAVLESRDAILQRLQDSEFMDKAESIIDGLMFPEMMLRRDTITPTAYDTYDWIFGPSSSFHTWLQSEGELFWISGKAGSGKSTLMKFLSRHRRTTELLRQWSGSSEFIVIDFYFWYSGTTMQKSVEGLLRSVLYQILSSCPDAVKAACPERWAESLSRTKHLAAMKWTEAELEESLDCIANVDKLHKRLCFFIDGLDEFHGDHQRLVNIVRKLAQQSRIKICVSSRPWNVFATAFEQRVPSLRLEDLTNHDIATYVYGELDELPRSTAFQQLVSEVVERAQGVFLWVFLVVRSLRSGLVEGDDLSMMQQRLDSFPSDLAEFFNVILSRVDGVYKRRTAEYLQLAMLCHSLDVEAVPQFLFWWLIAQGAESPDFLKQFEVRSVSRRQIAEMAKETQKSLRAACKDLLFVSSTHEGCWDSQVLFLHRTVFEYLQSDQVQQLLSKNTPNSFRHRGFLRRLHVTWFKLVPSDIYRRSEYDDAARRTLEGMKRYGMEDELGGELASIMLHYIRYPKQTLAHRNCGTVDIHQNCDFHRVLSWIATTRPKIIQGTTHHPWPLLYSVLGLPIEGKGFPLRFGNPKSVTMLLEAGADPNQLLHQTIWHLFLAKWYTEVQTNLRIDDRRRWKRGEKVQPMWDLASEMIKYGADLDTPVFLGSKDQSESATTKNTEKGTSQDPQNRSSNTGPLPSMCSVRRIIEYCVSGVVAEGLQTVEFPRVIRPPR